MTEEKLIPFSARNRGAHAQIDNECPQTTRTGLLHLLYSLVQLKYVEGWREVAAELQRIARVPPEFDKTARSLAQDILFTLQWDKVFDFCERLYSLLAKEVSSHNESNELEIFVQRSAVQEHIASELQRLFLEEHLAFEFSNGIVRRRGRRNTADRVARAEVVLGDPRLSSTRAHFTKALKFFQNVSQPDYENVVKEAVCAVEATARVLFPSGGRTLGPIVNSITGSEFGQLPQTIAKTFHGLYGFSSGGEGVRHGGADGGVVTKELAEYAMAVAASQIVLLVDLAITLEPEVPF